MKRPGILVVLTAVILAATLGASRLVDGRKPELLASPLEQMPSRLGAWAAVHSESLSDAVQRTLGADSYLSRVYTRSGQPLNLFVAYYALQRAGESMHSPKNCLPGSGWEIWKQGRTQVQAGGEPVQINRYHIQGNGKRWVVLYWYQTKERVIADEYLGKAYLAWDAVTKGRTGGSIVRITVADRPDSIEEGIAFAASVIPEVDRLLNNRH
jgi:EpsI family protein